MKAVSLNELRKNLYFSDSAFLDEEASYILLSPDTPVPQEMINRLMKWNIREIYSEDEATLSESQASSGGALKKTAPDAGGEDPAQTGGIIDLNTDVELQKTQREILEFYEDMLDFTEDMFEHYREHGTVPVSEVSEKVREMMEATREYKHHILNYSILEQVETPYLVGHSVRSTLLALAVGEALKLPPHRLLDLGLATILHEIGMVKLPQALHQTNKKLSEVEFRALTAHTVLGYRTLKQYSFSRDVLMGVLHHHERIDGTGYPQKLAGGSISEFGKLIGIVCSFDAQNTKRPYKKVKDGHSAIMEMLKEIGTKYDETLLRKFVFLLSLYPLGNYVKLKNGTIGIVSEGNAQNPRFPKVRLVLTPEEIPLKEQSIVQTAPQGDYQIVAVLSPEDTDRLRSEGKITG